MQIASKEIIAAITAELEQRGIPAGNPRLMPIEPPRDWGLTTNVCFTLGPVVAADEIRLKGEGLGKKEQKRLAAELGRQGGSWLAGHLAERLGQLAAAGDLPFVARVEAEGAYVNFYYDEAALTGHVTAQVLGQGADFGHGEPTGRRIMVEYAQPNTHKDLHVGHLRNASIGQAIANLIEFAGNDVLKATYIGDVGAHVAKAIWGSVNIGHDKPNYYEISRLIGWIIKGLVPGQFERLAEIKTDHIHTGQFDIPANRLEKWSWYYGFANLIIAALKVAATGSEDLVINDNDSPEIKRGKSSKLYAAEQLGIIESELSAWMDLWEKGCDPAWLVDNSVRKVREEWKQSREECVEAIYDLFSELQLSFTCEPDCRFYESTIDDTKLGQKTAAELKELGIAVVDESEKYKGALYVDFEQQADAVRPDGTPVFRDDEKKRIRKLGKMTILRSNGTSLYQTKELGLAKHKFDLVEKRFGAPLDESLYVVGAEQKLYFDQVFAILRLWGFQNVENCKHISYELVVLPEGKMSSREGNIVSYRELRDEAIKRARVIAREKGIGAQGADGVIDEAKVESIARDVAIAAIKFTMLQVTGNQQIVFDFEQALSFSGRAAPYLQYAYARTRKLVAGLADDAPAALPVHELHASEIALARLIAAFPATCRLAAERTEPALICNYLYDLASAFSDFYRDCRVLNAPEGERAFRQSLIRAFRRVMASGFKVLALPLPEEM